MFEDQDFWSGRAAYMRAYGRLSHFSESVASMTYRCDSCVKAGTTEGGSLQALLGLLINQGGRQGVGPKKVCSAVPCCCYSISGRPVLTRLGRLPITMRFVMTEAAMCTPRSGAGACLAGCVAIFSSHVSSNLNNDSALCDESLFTGHRGF
jgi:hypothetical protein